MALSSRPGAAESPATGQRDQGPEGLLSTVKPLVGTGGGGGVSGGVGVLSPFSGRQLGPAVS